MPENKTQPTKAGVAAFIEGLPDQTRSADAKLLVKLLRKITGEEPVMWGPAIVGFGSRHYKYDSGREGDIALVCFSPRKAATVIYLNMKSPDSQALLAKLGKHAVSGGCLHIKRLADVDQQVLERLIVRSITECTPV